MRTRIGIIWAGAGLLSAAAIAQPATNSAAPDGAPSATPSAVPGSAPPAVDRDVLHVQVILDHLGYSPGVLDGKRSPGLTKAIRGFQQSRGITVTGEIDQATLRALYPFRAWRPTKTLVLTEQTLRYPYVKTPDGPQEQAKLQQLGYETPMEKLAEGFHTTPDTLIALNSATTPLRPGTKVVFPNALPTSRAYDLSLSADWRRTLNMLNVDAKQPQAAKVVVDKSDGVLRVFDAQELLVAQFPATMGSSHDPLPIGDWKINGADYNPKFHYNPALFWDVSDSKEGALLPPGPNGPVGVVWLDLSKEHYGIHGTSAPETIGTAQSHGCIRLANWNAARLAMMVKPGTPAIFQQ